MKVYRGSDDYYTDWQIADRIETDVWSVHDWDEDSGEETVVTEDDERLTLTPVSAEELPVWAEIQPREIGARIVDLRAEPE